MELLGFETRNKYRVSDEQGQEIGFAAEQQKGFLGFILRQVLGHWRTFEIHFFSSHREPIFKAVHPFRLFFQRLEVFSPDGQRIGAIQQRFSILSKKFDVEDSTGQVVMSVKSPIWKIWQFPFFQAGHLGSEVHQKAIIQKKWSGLLNEMFTDKDKFLVEFNDQAMEENMKRVLLAAAIFVDLIYFEKKASSD